jgi:catechol 2,3-dioxygenase
LYFDRDAKNWQWQNNQVQMASIYLDPLQYIQQHLNSSENDDAAQMGHVHLKVGDIAQAKEFYVDVIGFDITAQLPGALFVSVGGYHHHIGLNTWESQGSPKRPVSLGLKSIEIILPSLNDLISLKKRLQLNEVPYEEEDHKIIIHDPWQNMVIVRA